MPSNFPVNAITVSTTSLHDRLYADWFYLSYCRVAIKFTISDDPPG